MLRRWADTEGLDSDSFGIALDRPDTTALLDSSEKEALLNRVDSLPCAFINGRKVYGEISIDMLVDIMEEEHERLKSARAGGSD